MSGADEPVERIPQWHDMLELPAEQLARTFELATCTTSNFWAR